MCGCKAVGRTQLIEVEQGAPAHPHLDGAPWAACRFGAGPCGRPPHLRSGAARSSVGQPTDQCLPLGLCAYGPAGGFLSREFLRDILGPPLLGGMGGQVGWSKRFNASLGDGPWAITAPLAVKCWSARSGVVSFSVGIDWQCQPHGSGGRVQRHGHARGPSIACRSALSTRHPPAHRAFACTAAGWCGMGHSQRVVWVSEEADPWRSTQASVWPAWTPFPTPADSPSAKSCLRGGADGSLPLTSGSSQSNSLWTSKTWGSCGSVAANNLLWTPVLPRDWRSVHSVLHGRVGDVRWPDMARCGGWNHGH